MLGWKILKEGDYKISLPRLSDAEEQMIEVVEERFREAARTMEGGSEKESEALIRNLLLSVAEEEGILLDNDQLEYLSHAAFLHIYAFAFIDLLVKDPEIEEISVIGINKPVYVYLKNQGWKSVNACFTNEKAIADVANKMARGMGRHITMQNPRLDAMLPDGSRLHASLPPVSQGEITIRKFRQRPFSPKELIDLKTTTAEALAFLSLVMQSDNSVLIGGNTGSGKTTLLNALFSFVPANERVLITEETPEINIPHKHQVRLVANRDMEIGLKDLMYDTLRMRPDRMIVGEVRNKQEFEALFDVLLAGQARGCYATLHSQGAFEACQRIKSFGINEMDVESVDCIIIQRRMLLYDAKKRKNVEVRKMTEIAEMDNGPKLLFSFDRKSGTLRFRSGGKLLQRVADSFGMSEKEIKKELELRKRLFSSLDSEFFSFYASLQKRLYGIQEEKEEKKDGGGE
jgi:Flp pilus assembly CpaF family ATPase